ncbi:wd40 repeat domain [Trypanosoma vivax]|uniref:Uncharacterized protein n=1 Tax=Trypanosoma vivax (strain Y486) TaxID=1055687 RepID=G0TR07_TRYVY|nr:wd40 repeat domain [Trypanosoma vivax]CCC46371.1 conserved hypothetical protein [Trypanosoma vivax Y486]
MFATPHCTFVEVLNTPSGEPFSAVYCDPYGGVWTVNASGRCVFYFPPEAVSSSNYPVGARFECGRTDDTVLSVIFPLGRNGSPCIACIVTTEGDVALEGVGDHAEVSCRSALGAKLTAVAPITLLGDQETMVSRLKESLIRESGISTVTFHSDGGDSNSDVSVLVSSFDGAFSEISLIYWSHVPRGGVGRRSEGKEITSITSLFRVRGHVRAVMVDEECKRIFTVNQRGDVDIWNYRREADETLLFNMPAYSAAEYGEPSSCILLGGQQLWVGTSLGCVLVFCLQTGVCPMGDGDVTSGATTNSTSKSGSSSGMPSHVWRVHGGVAVRSLLVMSLGRCVWSYAADQQAHVWDTLTLTLRGSLQFPGNNMNKLCSGTQTLDATMWGVNGCTGAVTQFRVKELLRCDAQVGLFGRDEWIIRQCKFGHLDMLRLLVMYLCSLLTHQKKSETLNEQLRGATQLPDDQSWNVGASDDGWDDRTGVNDIVVRNGIRVGDVPALSFPPYIELVLQQLDDEYPMVRSLAAAVSSFTVSSAVLKRLFVSEGWTSTTYIKDLKFLEEQWLEARALKHLKAEVLEERRRRSTAEKCLSEVRGENYELNQRLTRSLTLQEEHEERVDSLERQLASAKRAAAVSSAEATQLCEMEARLHESHCTITVLQERMEGLVRERQEHLRVVHENKLLTATVHRYEAKQEMAKRAFANFLATQSFLYDKLHDIVEEGETGRDGVVRASVQELLKWFSEHLEEQREFHLDLKRSYELQCAGGTG